jgi:hypothetical protein
MNTREDGTKLYSTDGRRYAKRGDVMVKTHGAVDIAECPSGGGQSCRCDFLCKWCGYRKHAAIHGPVNSGGPGSKPYGHMYESKVGAR